MLSRSCTGPLFGVPQSACTCDYHHDGAKRHCICSRHHVTEKHSNIIHRKTASVVLQSLPRAENCWDSREMQSIKPQIVWCGFPVTAGLLCRRACTELH